MTEEIKKLEAQMDMYLKQCRECDERIKIEEGVRDNLRDKVEEKLQQIEEIKKNPPKPAADMSFEEKMRARLKEIVDPIENNEPEAEKSVAGASREPVAPKHGSSREPIAPRFNEEENAAAPANIVVPLHQPPMADTTRRAKPGEPTAPGTIDFFKAM